MSRRRFAVRVLQTLDGETDEYYLADTSLSEYADCSGIAYTTELADAMTFRSRERAENPEYPRYSGAINVDKTRDIPIDYYGLIGVPITYLDKHNPERFFIHNTKR